MVPPIALWDIMPIAREIKFILLPIDILLRVVEMAGEIRFSQFTERAA